MRSTKRLHYAWIVAAVTFVVGLLTAGVRAAPGVLIIPLEQEFDWSRATISLAVGINLLLYGLVGPFAAALMDRFGVRRTMTLALGDNRRVGRLVAGHAPGMAAGFVVGGRRRRRHRRHRRLYLRLYRGALVSPPPGSGGRVC